MVTDLKDEGIIDILKMLETMMKVMPIESAIILTPMLSHPIKILLDTGPINTTLLSIAICIIARVVLYADDKFAETIDRVSFLYRYFDISDYSLLCYQ